MLRGVFPWCRMWKDELTQLFAAYVEAKQVQSVLDYDDLLLYWAEMVEEPALAVHWRHGSTISWSTSTKTPIGCKPRSSWR